MNGGDRFLEIAAIGKYFKYNLQKYGRVDKIRAVKINFLKKS
jgi:hypothetical protein